MTPDPVEEIARLLNRVHAALEHFAPPDPHVIGGGEGHACDAECEEVHYHAVLLHDVSVAMREWPAALAAERQRAEKAEQIAAERGEGWLKEHRQDAQALAQALAQRDAAQAHHEAAWHAAQSYFIRALRDRASERAEPVWDAAADYLNTLDEHAAFLYDAMCLRCVDRAAALKAAEARVAALAAAIHSFLGISRIQRLEDRNYLHEDDLAILRAALAPPPQAPPPAPRA